MKGGLEPQSAGSCHCNFSERSLKTLKQKPVHCETLNSAEQLGNLSSNLYNQNELGSNEESLPVLIINMAVKMMKRRCNC